ncbi:protein SODIUM POTASSIUM ROOT DEFECTIVE 2-like [Malania oleifera]|uniref:protein SODIUM POTASSIUM ROOT DEFECTIVE 2-like n=1 Tax=Malania oleifera TaxID=397392 RepID=UPI0025ADAC5A|nr:protein SODIUM POTASSIUM ROOT DEFECTIVE 2-like [Malania oleifera]
MKGKRMDIFCVSPASTAICSSMEQRSMVRHSMRPIDRQNPHFRDRRRHHPPIPCSSQAPINPKPYNINQKGRKSYAKQTDVSCRKSSTDRNGLTSPPTSSRYLLSDMHLIDLSSDSDPLSALVPAQPAARPKELTSRNDSPALSSSSSARSRDQVVVLWVSLHCKGCEGKVRKHISRMEGVTSFSIDLETKKVTVIGDVTPLGVLASVSKVKNAQLWPSSTSPSSLISPPYST